MYTAEIIQLATRYASPSRLIGKKSKVYGQQGSKVGFNMQTRKLFG
jgi:hypothetical protein